MGNEVTIPTQLSPVSITKPVKVNALQIISFSVSFMFDCSSPSCLLLSKDIPSCDA